MTNVCRVKNCQRGATFTRLQFCENHHEMMVMALNSTLGYWQGAEHPRREELRSIIELLGE